MKLQHIEPILISGLNVRTNNADESTIEPAKIGDLWTQFYAHVAPQLSSNSIIYGVYTNYQSDVNGDYDVIAGATSLLPSPNKNLVDVELQAGKYLTFSAKGEMPQTVINLWGDVWQYFHQGDCPHTRAYTTDFEQYKSDDEIDIFIAIK